MLVFEAVAKWLNDNQGVLGAAIFLLTLCLGWVSGIFSDLPPASRTDVPPFSVALSFGVQG